MAFQPALRFAGLVLTLLAVLVFLLPGCGAEASYLGGKVVASREGKLIPIPAARVTVKPVSQLEDGAKFSDEQPSVLRGLATTQSSGTFEIAVLSSPMTQQEYPLLRGWRYSIQIEVPGYYIASSEFDYLGGNRFLEVEIAEKVVDVLDDSGGIETDTGSRSTVGVIRRN
ncbi:MAG: hypothetical protein VX498_15485 [Myxococcota bacterium]|nr:hypothetical protein [Myxococcota bacterium]